MVCQDLLTLLEPPEGWKPATPEGAGPDAKPAGYQPDVPQTVSALKAALNGFESAPTRISILGLSQLAKLDDAVFSDPQVMELLLKMAGPMRVFHRETEKVNAQEK